MKRITILTMLCCTLFCVCAIASGIGRERKLLFITSLPVVDHTPPASTSVAVSGEVITHLDTPTVTADHDRSFQKKKAEVQTVIDLTGKKQKLKLGNVNINNKEVFIPKDSSAEYAQVADGHYYYLRREGERRYTLYCDKGDKVGRFWIDKWYYYESCFKYGDRFYVILYHFDEYPRITIDDEYCILTVVDFTSGKLRKLRRIENLEDYDVYLYKDKIRLYYSPDDVCDDVEDDDEEDDGWEHTYQYDITGDGEPVESFEYRGYVMDGSRYYAKIGKEICIFRQNMKNEKEEEIFRYRTKRKEKKEEIVDVSLDVDEEDMFIQERIDEPDYSEKYCLYVVPRSGGEMKLVTDELDHDCSYTYNSRYIFWMDCSHGIHRWNRKTKKEEKMVKTPLDNYIYSYELNCTEKGLYIQECRKDGESGRPGYNLYYMGVEKDEFELVWDDKKYIDDAWPNH